MKHKKIVVIISIIIIIITAGTTAAALLLFNDHGVATFTGKISEVKDCNSWIGGATCTYVVDGNSVIWSGGSALKDDGYGRVELGNGERVGKTVEVHAARTGLFKYELQNDSHYIIER